MSETNNNKRRVFAHDDDDDDDEDVDAFTINEDEDDCENERVSLTQENNAIVDTTNHSSTASDEVSNNGHLADKHHHHQDNDDIINADFNLEEAINTLNIMSTHIPEPLSPTLPNKPFQFPNPFSKNASFEEYLCSLSYNCICNESISSADADGNTNDPFQMFLKQEYTGSSESIEGHVSNSSSIVSDDDLITFNPRVLFDKYSVLFGGKSFSKSLQTNAALWNESITKLQREKKQQSQIQKSSKLPTSDAVSSPIKNVVERPPISAILASSSDKLPNSGRPQSVSPPLSDLSHKDNANESSHNLSLGDQASSAVSFPASDSVLPSPSPTPAKQATKKILPTRRTQSDLSASEHREYLDMQKKMTENKELAAQIAKSGRFIDLHSRVLKEQHIFKQAMFDEAMIDMDKYKLYHPNIHNQLEKEMEFKRQRIANLPAKYLLIKSVDIGDIMPVFGVDPMFRPQRHLLRIGKCRHFRPHIFDGNDFHFQRDINLFNNSITSTVVNASESPNQMSSSDTASDQAEERTEKQIEYDAFKSVDIQIESQGNENEDGTSQAKVEGKKAPPILWKKPTFCPVSQDVILSDYILKSIKPSEFKSDTIYVLSSSTLQEILDTHWPALKEEWTVPVRVTTNEHGLKCIFLDKPLMKKVYTTREKNDMYYKVAIKSYGLNMSEHAYFVDYNQEQAAQALMKDMNQRGQKENVSTSEANMNYSMFELGASRILIRYHIDGLIPDATPMKYRSAGIKSKVEYLGKRCQEEVTRSEAARWWAHTYIRQDEELHIGRINIKNNSVQRMERVGTHSEIITKYRYEPSRAIKLLNILLSEIKALEPGNITYLARHSSGGRALNIYKEYTTVSTSGNEVVDVLQPVNNNLYDLAMDYKNAGVTDTVTIPYVPKVWDVKSNRIPHTFPVAPEQKSNKNKKGNASANNKRKYDRSHSKKKAKKLKQTHANSPVSPFGAPPIRPVVSSSVSSSSSSSVG